MTTSLFDEDAVATPDSEEYPAMCVNCFTEIEWRPYLTTYVHRDSGLRRCED